MIVRLIVLSCMLVQHAIMISHGFAANTLIALENDQEFLKVREISIRFFQGQKTEIATYKEKSKKWKIKPVQAVAYCQANSFFELSFGSSEASLEKIVCSPLQLFYRVFDCVWVPAYQLCEGDELLCKNNQITRLQSKKQMHADTVLYILEVKKYHTFAVGLQKILTHNMFIPVAGSIGVAIPFDILFHAGSWGCMFGPVTFCCSIAVAGVAAAIAYQCGKEKCTDFILKCESVGRYEIQKVDHWVRFYRDEYCLKSSVDDILLTAKSGEKTRGPSIQYVKPGNYEDALKDFEKLKPSDVQNLPKKEGKKGFLSDGRKINVRPTSSGELPTIEIQPIEKNGKKIKIRYDDKQDKDK